MTNNNNNNNNNNNQNYLYIPEIIFLIKLTKIIICENITQFIIILINIYFQGEKIIFNNCYIQNSFSYDFINLFNFLSFGFNL